MSKNKIICEKCLFKANLGKHYFCPMCGNDLYKQYWLAEINKREETVSYELEHLELAKCIYKDLPKTNRLSILKLRFNFYRQIGRRNNYVYFRR